MRQPIPSALFCFWTCPGHGRSDRLTWPQRREIIATQRISKIGYAQAEALRNYLPDANEVIVVGDSLGARATPDFAVAAGQLNLKPLAIAGFDMVGADKRPSIRMAKAFFISEKQRQRHYHAGPNNERLDRAYEVDFKNELAKNDIPTGVYKPTDVFKNDPLISIFLVARSPLASDTAFDSIEQAMDENSQLEAAFVSGAISKICRWQRVEPAVNKLSGEYSSRFTWDVWPHDSHTMSIAPQQPRMAAFVSRLLKENNL